MRSTLLVFLVSLLISLPALSAAPRGAKDLDMREGGGQSDDLGMSQYALSLVGHAHIDLAYRWRWNETVRRIAPDTFRGVLDLMERERGLTFAQSQMALYDAVKREYPDLESEIKARVAEGRWILVGGTWSESDMMIPGGESFVRQRLIGMEFAREEFGVPSIDVLWAPDSFCGHAGTLPKILSRCGVKYYVLGRGAPQDKPIFWWQAADGARILAYSPAAPYNLRLAALSREGFRLLERWFQHAGGVKNAMLLYGAGDHGGGPRMDDVEKKRALAKWRGAPKAAYETPQDYFRKYVEPYQDNFPVHHGSLGGLGNISYVSQARNKQLNRECENLLVTAEKFATLGTFYQQKPSYPRVDFVEVWKPVLFNQFHDIIAGTSNGRVHEDAQTALQSVLEEGRRLLAQGIERIAGRIDTRGEGIPLVVFNPLSWSRTEVAETTITFLKPTECFAIKDDHGGEVPYQKIEADAARTRWRIAFLAEEVPSIGYKVFRVHPGVTAAPETALKASVTQLENEYLRVSLSPTGTVLSMWDKATGRETLRGEANVFTLREETNPSSSWSAVLGTTEKSIEPVGQPELLEAGPVRAVVRRTFRSEDSVFAVNTILGAGSPRLEFELSADWHEKDVTLLANFPTSVDGGAGAIELPYGFEEVKPDGARHCAQQWIDLSNADYGVSLLNNGRYEFYVDNDTLRMGVLRGARNMDPRMDEGHHRFQYALYPHSGSWRDADTVRQGYALNHPLIALQESHHTGATDSWTMQRCDFSLPSAQSLIGVSGKNVVVAVVKMPEDEWTLSGEVIVRVLETAGRPAQCELTLPFSVVKAVETDHLEETVLGEAQADGNKVIVGLEPGELKTLKLHHAGLIPSTAGGPPT